MGLAAAYGTIKSHNGIINVYSEEGHGTTFNIYLPVLSKESPSEPVEVNLNKGSETVLIVDDEEGIIRLCERLLKRANYEVRATTNPIEGAGLLQQESFDLLLVDIRMPEMDGFKLIDKARQIQP